MTHPARTASLLAVPALALTLAACSPQPNTDTSPTPTNSETKGSSESGSSGASSAESSRLDTIKSEGSLTVCTTGDYAPFTVEKDGKYTGIDVDMAKDLAKKLDVDIKWVKSSWPTLMKDFTTKCDIAVGGISVNDERKKEAAFSTPQMKDGKTPIARCEDKDKYRTVEQINKPDVVSIMPDGGTNQEFAEKHYPKGKLKTHDNRTIFDQIIDGKADVMTTDRSEVLYVSHEREELCATNPDKPFDEFDKAYLLPKDDAKFKKYVDAWLEESFQDGTYSKLEKPWVGDQELSYRAEGEEE